VLSPGPRVAVKMVKCGRISDRSPRLSGRRRLPASRGPGPRPGPHPPRGRSRVSRRGTKVRRPSGRLAPPRGSGSPPRTQGHLQRWPTPPSRRERGGPRPRGCASIGPWPQGPAAPRPAAPARATRRGDSSAPPQGSAALLRGAGSGHPATRPHGPRRPLRGRYAAPPQGAVDGPRTACPGAVFCAPPAARPASGWPRPAVVLLRPALGPAGSPPGIDELVPDAEGSKGRRRAPSLPRLGVLQIANSALA
jgi:hypothetical protein